MQLLYVVRLRFQEYLIVRYKALNETVFLRLLPLLIPPIYEDPLDISMPLAAGIAGVVDPLREVIYTTETGNNGLHLELRQLGSLI